MPCDRCQDLRQWERSQPGHDSLVMPGRPAMAALKYNQSVSARARHLLTANERLDTSGHDPLILPMIAIMPGTSGMRTYTKKNPKFIPASASWSKVRRKFRLTRIMLDCNSSVESSSKRVVSVSLSLQASCTTPWSTRYTCSGYKTCMTLIMSWPHPKHNIANAKWATYFIYPDVL